MDSSQDSIENCSICQNSRKNNFPMSPNNYKHIFGYIGPAHKYNKISPKASSNEIRRKSSSKLFYPKNLDVKKDKSQTWMRPGTFLYNMNSSKCDKTKMRYDESETDFEDWKYSDHSFQAKKEIPIEIRRKRSTAGKSTSKVKAKKTVASFDSESCMSFDSLSKGRNKGKKGVHKTDSEDVQPKIKNKVNNNCKNVKTAMKKKLETVASDFSLDSARRYDNRRMGNRTSKSSLKLKNLTLMVNSIGSIESIKRKDQSGCRRDPEDYDAKAVNSDFSVNSRDHYVKQNKNKKRRNLKKRASDSSTELSAKTNLKDSFFGSIESIKKYRNIRKKPQQQQRKQQKSHQHQHQHQHQSKKYKEDAEDAEDQMFTRDLFPCSSRKKSSTARTPFVKRKKKTESKCCFICWDQKFNFDKTNNKY